ncbi:MAG: DUF2865 domain-containing protein [Pseudomonadota bacterium]
MFPFSSFPPPSASKKQPRKRSGGGVRTVCVRVCDGYYFPINFRSSHRRLRRDAKVCQARCPGQGRLYYMTGSRAEIETARDRRGRRYTVLKTAFRYRKSLTPNCACKPEPWTLSERMRHAGYAIDAGHAVSGKGIAANVVAGSYANGGKPPKHSELTRVRVYIDVPPGTEGQPTVIAGGSNDVTAAVRKPRSAGSSQRRVAEARRRTRRRPARRRQSNATRKPSKPKAAATGGFFSVGGPSKFRWPGD